MADADSLVDKSKYSVFLDKATEFYEAMVTAENEEKWNALL